MGEEAGCARLLAGMLPFAPRPEMAFAGGRVTDEIFMARALELARGAPFTSPNPRPNPRVGALVVRAGRVVGQGRHEGPGDRHAERVALDGVPAAGATLYVTLEPCVHHGRTGPCAPELVGAGLARVVVGMVDPDERVAGRGIAHLRAAGIEVDVGVLETEARLLNAPYLWQRTRRRPLVTLKLALTLDGRLGASDGSSQWITGDEARAAVHRRRAQVDAVLVGAGTVLADDPSLTARAAGAARQPVRVVADSRGIVPPTARAIAGPGEVIVATTARCSHERQTAYKERGAEVLVLEETAAGIDLAALLDHLGGRGYLEVLCEGGATLATELVRVGLVQRLHLFYGPLVTGGGPALDDLGIATLAHAPRWTLREAGRLGSDFFARLDSPELTALVAPRGGSL